MAACSLTSIGDLGGYLEEDVVGDVPLRLGHGWWTKSWAPGGWRASRERGPAKEGRKKISLRRAEAGGEQKGR